MPFAPAFLQNTFAPVDSVWSGLRLRANRVDAGLLKEQTMKKAKTKPSVTKTTTPAKPMDFRTIVKFDHSERSIPLAIAICSEGKLHCGGHCSGGYPLSTSPEPMGSPSGRADVDRLPVAVEHQHNRLVQYGAHKLLA